MQFKQHYSGSTGNLYEITANNGKRLLIECGMPWKKIGDALQFNTRGIVGCVVSHQHKDHSKSMKDVMDRGIDVYSNQATLESQNLQDHHRAKAICNKDLIQLDTFSIFAFDVNHDVDALGFVVRCDDEFLLFITDSSHVNQCFKWAFSVIAIECNYDKEILDTSVKAESINESHAKRLLDSHMEKEETKRYLKKFVDMSKCTELNLLHLSSGNINAEKTRKEFEEMFFLPVKIV